MATAAGAGVLALAGADVPLDRARRNRWSDLRLHGAGVGIEPDGSRVLVPVDASGAVQPGSRVVAASRSQAARAQLDAEQEWLLAGAVPGGPRWGGMARDALLDLRTLLLPGGAPVAAWSSPWRYVWPRDAAFVAAALAGTGHLDDALAVLGFLQRVQRPDGLFEARYLPDGSGRVPDRRGIQRDGTGWALWGTRRVLAAVPGPDRPAVLAGLEQLVLRSTDAAIRMTRTANGLPQPSRDYWEVAETRTTLGISAPVLAGLRAAVPLTGQLSPARSRDAALAAGRLQAVVLRTHSPNFGRYPRGPRTSAGRGADSAMTFLAAPIGTVSGPVLARARHRAEQVLRQPAGGLSPGLGWRDDGASWTPETALFALAAAAAGERDRATTWLDWLSGQRTAMGSLPEKVQPDGTGAGPAPLAWTAALVLLTLLELES